VSLNRHNKFNGRVRRYEVRVKYANGTYGLWGYCDNPIDPDVIAEAERHPSVDVARIMNPKTGKPFSLDGFQEGL
jgi:hypothetical protein